MILYCIQFILSDIHSHTKEPKQFKALKLVIDNPSRAIGDFAAPLGDYSLDYIEEKVKNAH